MQGWLVATLTVLSCASHTWELLLARHTRAARGAFSKKNFMCATVESKMLLLSVSVMLLCVLLQAGTSAAPAACAWGCLYQDLMLLGWAADGSTLVLLGLPGPLACCCCTRWLQRLM